MLTVYATNTDLILRGCESLGFRCLLERAIKLPPHPEEPADAFATAGVSKDGHELRVPALVLRDAMLRMAPQDEGSKSRSPKESRPLRMRADELR